MSSALARPARLRPISPKPSTRRRLPSSVSMRRIAAEKSQRRRPRSRSASGRQRARASIMASACSAHRRVPQASTPADPDMVRQVEFKHVGHTGAAHLEPAQRLRACTGRGDGARERMAGADEGFAVREKTALFPGCRGEPERHRGKALGKVPQRTFRRIADEQSGQGVAHLRRRVPSRRPAARPPRRCSPPSRRSRRIPGNVRRADRSPLPLR